MKNLSSNKGITLTMLVITIIVILIIAGISITGAITGVDSANDSRAITDLEKVQHAVTQRYSKYKLLNDTSLLVGTKINLSDLTDVPETIDWRVFQPSTDTNPTTNLDRKYYRLSKSDMENLGLTGDYKGSSYVVNYCSGEVYDEGQKQTSDGKVLYKTAISEEISGLGNDVIHDGLLVWYDAINNTGSGHSGTTKTWFDLSGNGNNATLNGFDGTATSGWNSNYLAFDGTNDYSKTIKEINYNNSKELTIEFIDINGKLALNNNLSILIESSSNYNNFEKSFHLNTNENGNNKDFRFNYRKSFGTTLNYHIRRTKNNFFENGLSNEYSCVLNTNATNNQLMKIYKNGEPVNSIEITQNATISNETINNYILYIGARDGKQYFTKMNLANLKVYNKALSEDEIHHNYILDKNRYGIEE